MTHDRIRNIARLVRGGGRSFSFEFFPPKDDAGEEQLWRAIGELEPYAPTFVSVTYGAGGSSRDKTLRITGRIASETSLTAMAHLTCVGHTREELSAILESYASAGIRNVLVLRGDPSDGPRAPWEPTPGGLTYASELVEMAAARRDFTIGVAAFPEVHPSSGSLDQDADVLAAKARAGAGFAVTQMFFRSGDYFELVDRVRDRGVDIPIIPGVMPILNLGAIQRVGELIGAEVPEEIVKRVSAHDGDRAAVRAEGIAITTELCESLLAGGAPGLHFYTLNQSRATREIYEALGLAELAR